MKRNNRRVFRICVEWRATLIGPQAGWQAPLSPLAASRRKTRTGVHAMRQIASHILVFLVSVSLSGAMLSPAIV
jgi:hypothetical protein